MRTLVFESYGNNEVRIGFNDLPVRLKRDNDSPDTKALARLGHNLDKSISDDLRDSKQFMYRDKDGQLYRGNVEAGYDAVVVDPSKLDIIHKLQDNDSVPASREKRGYGDPPRPTSFTRAARHKLLEGGQLFDREYSSTHYGNFATFTLPGSTRDAYDAISRWSGYLANRVLQTLRDWDRETIWFYAWELQRRGALHLHLFFSCKREKSVEDITRGLRAVWYRCLEDISFKEGTCLFRHEEGEYCTASSYWQFDCQTPKKSPAAYISKYVGKSANAPGSTAELEDGGFSYYPHRWWGMCRPLKKLIDQHRFNVCIDSMTVDDCMDALRDVGAQLEEWECVAEKEYVADISSKRRDGQIIGVSYRRIFWFKPEDFPVIDALFRIAVSKYVRKCPAHTVRWKYDSLVYKDTFIWNL